MGEDSNIRQSNNSYPYCINNFSKSIKDKTNKLFKNEGVDTGRKLIKQGH